MRHRNNDMLLRIAQGDAFAIAVEYVKREEHKDLYEAVTKFDSYHQHPHYSKLRPGQFTDDTQMSIAVTEALIDAKYPERSPASPPAAWLTAEHFSHRFFEAFKRDPRDGYSRAFQQILEEATSPIHLRQLIVPDSNKNGAAMRSVPIGVIKNPEDVVKIAGIQAAVTHATWGGINSSVIVALMSHFALYDRRSFASMKGWGIRYCPAFEHFSRPWVGPVTGGWKTEDPTGLGVGMNTAWAVYTLLVECNSLRDIMMRVLEWGGDTDSVASIAWGIASTRYSEEKLPEFLERDLEAGGAYGPEFLKALGTSLMNAYS